jgi:hypothetical protein
VEFVVGQSGAGQVFSECFGFPCNRRSLHQLLHNHSHISSGEMYNRPMCGHSTGTYTNLGNLQRDLRGLSPTPPNKKKINNHMCYLLISPSTTTLNNTEDKTLCCHDSCISSKPFRYYILYILIYCIYSCITHIYFLI